MIVITGPFLLYMLESNLDLTLASLYGKWLIIKLSLAAVMIALGGYNQVIIYRQTLRASILSTTARGTGRGRGGEVVETKTNSNNNNHNNNREFDHQTQTTKQKNLLFPNSTGAQKQNRLLVSRCLLPVALLVNTGLPASEFHQQQNAPAPTTGNTITAQQDQGITATRFVEDGSRVILSINPYTPGNNNFKISFLDSNRNPIDIKSVTTKIYANRKRDRTN